MYLYTVLPLKKIAYADELSYYGVREIASGTLIEIPFRSQQIPALVIACEPLSNQKGNLKKASFNVRKITRELGPSPFRASFVQNIGLLAKYYGVPSAVFWNTIASKEFLESEFLEIIANTSTQKNKKKALELPEVFAGTFEERVAEYVKRAIEAKEKGVDIFICAPTEREVLVLSATLKEKNNLLAQYTLHGGLTDKARKKVILESVSAKSPVLYVATPKFFALLGIKQCGIILEHESAPTWVTSFQQSSMDWRTLFAVAAEESGRGILHADTRLSFTTETYLQNDLYAGHKTKHKDAFIQHHAPKKEHFSSSKYTQPDGKNVFALFPPETRHLLENALLREKNIFIYCLRNGFAQTVICNDCQTIHSCPNCAAPLSVAQAKDGTRTALCGICHKKSLPPDQCVVCGGWNMTLLGVGIERVVEEFKKLYPSIPFAVVSDAYTPQEKNVKVAVDSFYAGDVRVLIGTERARGLLVDGVDMCVVTSFESLLAIPHFRISERVIELLYELRSFTRDTLVIQTNQKENPLLHVEDEKSYRDWFQQEYAGRKALGYPPFGYMATIEIATKDASDLKKKLTEAEAILAGKKITASPTRKIYGKERIVTLSLLLKIPEGLESPGTKRIKQRLALLEILRQELGSHWRVIPEKESF